MLGAVALLRASRGAGTTNELLRVELCNSLLSIAFTHTSEVRLLAFKAWVVAESGHGVLGLVAEERRTLIFQFFDVIQV